MQEEIPDGQNVCPLNKVKSKSKDILDSHIQKHSEKQSFTCEVCHKCYSKKCSLNVHMKCHSRGNPYKCEKCDLKFAEMRHLQRHWKIHKGQKQYICEICNKNLSSSTTLKKHRLSHTGEKPHSCEICNRGFADSSKLISHRKALHENKKPACEDSLSFDIHRDHCGNHPEDCNKCKNPYVCEICNRRCKSDSDLAIHKHFHEKTKITNMESKADTLCNKISAEEAVIYSQFMRKNFNTYGKRSKNIVKDNN